MKRAKRAGRDVIADRIAAAIDDEERTGRFAEQLRSALIAEHRVDAAIALVRDAMERIPARVRVKQAARVRSAILEYWRLEHDIIDDGLGMLGLLDDLIVAFALLSRLGTAEDDEQILLGLRELVADGIDRRIRSVVEALWEGEDLSSAVVDAGAVDPERVLARPSRAPETIRARGPRAEPPAAAAAKPISTVQETTGGARRFDVWFATNRSLLTSGTSAVQFGSERDPAGTIRYGTCAIEVPKSHDFGSVGTSWWKRWIRLEFADDHIKVLQRDLFRDGPSFFADLRKELAMLAEDANQVLFYLHGFNVSFDEAAIRAAQLFADLKPPGAAAFFSWPSKASVEAYFADAERIGASEADIAQFLTQLATELDGATIHIIAHSMGNRGLARAIQRITTAASREAGVKFGQIILAAPDVDMTLFNDLARIYPRISRRTTMYVSASDRALGMSKWLQDSPRAGFTPPVTVVPDIDTVEVTEIDITILGHGYYAEAEPVLYDIADLLHHGTPPERRLRIRASEPAGTEPRHWMIAK